MFRFSSFLLGILVVWGCATSPTGRRQLKLVPDSQMNSMGAGAFDEMKQKVPREHDVATNRYVRCISYKIVAEAKDDTGVQDWEVVVFKDKSANAFALPGGKIGVHTGMLRVAKNQHQLAAVLGHEVGHVIARHGNERVSQSFATQGGLAAIASALDPKDSNHGLLFGALSIGSQVGVLLPFGRTQESEADEIGQKLMAQAGFDPKESVKLWQNMAKTGGGGPPEFLSTHPSHGTRINGLNEKMSDSVRIYRSARDAGKRPNCSAPRRYT